jgi:ATP-dependent Clp protease ATP-binding subunit ClpA
LWDVQAERLLKIEDELRRRVVGQDEAIKVPTDPCLNT